MSNLDWSNQSYAQLQATLMLPAMDPPTGVQPDFENPKNENTIALIALVLCVALSALFLLIRIYVVFIKIRQPHLGDYVLLVAYLVLLGDEFWILAIGLLKSAILIEWHRLFAPTRARTAFRVSCLFLLVINILAYAALFVILNLNCIPFAKIWNKALKGRCIDLRKIHLCVATVDLVIDIAILVLPQRIIWQLKMSTLMKVGVSAVFTVGILATIASVFLIYAISLWIGSSDMSYRFSSVVLWAIAEATCGIIVFCAPVLPKFFQILLPNAFFKSSSWGLCVAKKVRWPSSFQHDERQPRSKSREYRELNESGSIQMREYGSPRPTDRQYGIQVVTDITIDFEPLENVGPRGIGPHSNYPWAG
ncbi:hypothetical protein F5Y16DRAFT_405402 [Xylariaceae sp. FL0255]|nr:hypothetical protein F5Y16DRAFT_405402 [Xylariaceae sp. FL0255]